MTNDELSEVIAKAAREGATELDLSGKGLTALPPEIGQLTNLTTLRLDGNELTTLPEAIAQPSNSKILAKSFSRL